MNPKPSPAYIVLVVVFSLAGVAASAWLIWQFTRDVQERQAARLPTPTLRLTVTPTSTSRPTATISAVIPTLTQAPTRTPLAEENITVVEGDNSLATVVANWPEDSSLSLENAFATAASGLDQTAYSTAAAVILGPPPTEEPGEESLSSGSTETVEYSDTFDEKSWRWDEAVINPTVGSRQFSVENGVYHWLIDPNQSLGLGAILTLRPVGDFQIEVSARLVEGPPESSMGIQFRFVSASLFNYCLISNYGSYGCFQNLNSQTNILIDWTASSAVKPFDWNHIRLEAIGDEFRLYINGVYVDSFSDTQIDQGRVGLTAAVYIVNSTVIFEFDDFNLEGLAE